MPTEITIFFFFCGTQKSGTEKMAQEEMGPEKIIYITKFNVAIKWHDKNYELRLG